MPAMSLSTANSAPNPYPGTSISGSNQYLGLRISVRGSFVFPKPRAEPALNRASLGVGATGLEPVTPSLKEINEPWILRLCGVALCG
jgi:hypothetical protein